MTLAKANKIAERLNRVSDVQQTKVIDQSGSYAVEVIWSGGRGGRFSDAHTATQLLNRWERER